VGALVALATAHEKPEFMREAFESDLSQPDRVLLLAIADGEIAGYGRGSHFKPASEAPANVAPEGYYLGGLLVAERWRRRGIALWLTRARMAWAFERAPEVWYFTNARNAPSLALHAKAGFVEVTREFFYPDVSFEGGVGVLGHAQLDDTAIAAAP
jgi:ribosomal protein S18 acetylase RimI-like enzyme